LDMHSYNYHQDEITVLVNKQDCVVTRNEYHKFDCPQCHLTCSFPTFLETHVYYFCGQTTIECPECADSFETILQLNTHINSHHAIPSIPHSRNATPELSSPMSSTLTSSSSSSLDDPIVSRKLKRVRFSCHSCLNTFESDDDMRDHIYSDTCTPKIGNKSIGQQDVWFLLILLFSSILKAKITTW
jgi:hypothetical protein